SGGTSICRKWSYDARWTSIRFGIGATSGIRPKLLRMRFLPVKEIAMYALAVDRASAARIDLCRLTRARPGTPAGRKPASTDAKAGRANCFAPRLGGLELRRGARTSSREAGAAAGLW